MKTRHMTMNCFFAFWVLFVADGRLHADALTLQNGLNEYEDTHNVSITGNPQKNTEMNFAGSPTLIISGLPRGGWKCMVFVRFDNLVGGGKNQIPAGVAVLSARLLLHKLANQPRNEGQYSKQKCIINAYPMLLPFEEKMSCFSYRAYSKELPVYWGNKNMLEQGPVPNIDFKENLKTSSEIPWEKDDVWMEWDVTKIAASWIENPPSNQGMYLINACGDWLGASFDSCYAANPENRPKLIIQFTLKK